MNIKPDKLYEKKIVLDITIGYPNKENISKEEKNQRRNNFTNIYK